MALKSPDIKKYNQYFLASQHINDIKIPNNSISLLSHVVADFGARQDLSVVPFEKHLSKFQVITMYELSRLIARSVGRCLYKYHLSNSEVEILKEEADLTPPLDDFIENHLEAEHMKVSLLMYALLIQYVKLRRAIYIHKESLSATRTSSTLNSSWYLDFMTRDEALKLSQIVLDWITTSGKSEVINKDDPEAPDNATQYSSYYRKMFFEPPYYLATTKRKRCGSTGLMFFDDVDDDDYVQRAVNISTKLGEFVLSASLVRINA